MKLSLPALLWNDWPALASWIGVLVSWALYCAAWLLMGKEQVADFFPFAIAVTLACCALAAWRTGRVVALFASGIDVPGRVTYLQIVGDRARLEVRYRVGEAEFDCWAPVHKTARVLALSPGQAVRVLANRANPRHAIVKDLYVTTPAALASM